jgi:rRNA-processing protein FCF1
MIMQRFSDNLGSWAESISELLIQLLQASSIRPSDWMGEDLWSELDDPARQIQSKVLEEYRRFSSVLEVLYKEQPDNTISIFQEKREVVLGVIQQQSDQNTYFRNCDQALEQAKEALNTQISLLNRLYTASQNRFVVVPDTNALLFNPDLQDWSFDSVGKFTIVLMTTVLAELDKLKVDSRSESVRQKSEKLVRQIKGYRARGRLTEGVTLVKNKSQIIAVAVEPIFSESLSWHDANNNDDRLLASCLEIVRQMPHDQVLLVTRDINLQNKAEFAHIPYMEPPGLSGIA